jgi:hypothetical protein
MKTTNNFCDICRREVTQAEKRKVAGIQMSLCPYHVRRFFAFHPFIYIDGWTERSEEALDEIFSELNDNVVVLSCRSTPLDEAFPEDYSAMLSALRHASNALYGDRTERRGMIYIVLNSPLTVSAWYGGLLPDLSRNFVRPAVWVNSLDYTVRIGEAVLGIRKFINMQKNAFPPTQVFQFRGKPSPKTMLNMAWNLWRRQHEAYLLRKAERQ